MVAFIDLKNPQRNGFCDIKRKARRLEMAPDWLSKAKWSIKWIRNYLKPDYDEIYYTENYLWAFGHVKWTIQWATNVCISRNMVGGI